MDFIAGFFSGLGSVLWSLLALIVTFGILVVVHEFGHFYVARLFGVKVLRFSVGFGKVLWSKTDSKGTEFVVSALPLGGYVSMLGEQSETAQGLSEEELAGSLARKTPWQRIAIAFAGPAFNLLLAIAIYWLIRIVGMTVAAPYVGDLPPDSPAAHAGMTNGQHIVAVDGRETSSWLDVALALSGRLGDTGTLVISAKHAGKPDATDYSIPIDRWLSDTKEPDPPLALGFDRRKAPAVLGAIVPNSPASEAGLREGDLILSVNSNTIRSWREWVDAVGAAPNQKLSLVVWRNNSEVLISLTAGVRETQERGTIGFAGVYRPMVRATYGPLESIPYAISDTFQMSWLTLVFIKKMIFGLVSPSTVGGPLTIADLSGKAATQGFQTFLYLLALLNVTLAVINLLPIPVLDGGHILFHTLEILRGKPLSENVQRVGFQVGALMIFGIMLLAIFNDLNRYIFDLGRLIGG